MPMLPVLPPYADETTVSWGARVARFHTGMTCADFLKMVEIKQAHIMDLNVKTVERLSKFTGVPETQILGGGPQKAGERLLAYKGETFNARFMTRTYTTYCPACLIDDAAAEANGDRVGRLSWMFSTVRVCPRHGILLTRRKNLGYYERFQDMNLVAPEDDFLRKQGAEAERRRVSPLQAYVEDRFSGASGPAWLDNQGIDQASKACEMLGICRLMGADVDLRTPTLAEWDEAGAIGYAAASQGPVGIYSILDEITAPVKARNCWGGPQLVLGRIFKWLQYNKSHTDPGPILDCVREYIVDTMPVDPETVLFGHAIEHRKRHSVPTLAEYSGIHVKTINRAVAVTGLLANVDLEVIDVWRTFDATAGEALADRINRSLPIKSAPEYLNCNRTQAQMLVKCGILKQVAPGLGLHGGVLTQVPLDEIDSFLEAFRSSGRPVTSASKGMMNVIDASEIARETAADIVRMVLDGRLSKVELLNESLRFRSVLVDPDEVYAVANASEDHHGCSVAETARRLGVSTVGVTHLRTKLDETGRPFLQVTEVINARGSVRLRFAVEEIQRFLDIHVSLKDLAKREGVSTKAMSKRLSDRGIEPIMDRVLLRSKVFRRADL
ncbi:TniQ protein [Roseovarius nanhaiticus]|uniref:TniQ protein n=3 Tax=Roseovarius nanhaiticus TaxID=573024 RepID=A0A1N7HB74_9RHOB|nr:TniQ protein [Roseovarius nanhaiticus]SIS22129.1 TniQ protein [Roseovarius nanhaiticus]